MGYQIRLEVFEGPFDLLLDLLDKSEIDIWDIPIATIAEQYLDYLHQMQEMDLVVSGDFLVMAATLLEIKTKMLIPSEPDDEVAEESEEDPRKALVHQLLEYKFFKQIAQVLQEQGDQSSKIYPRGYCPEQSGKPPIFNNPLGEVSLTELARYYQQVLEVASENKRVRKIPRRVTLAQRLAEVRLLITSKRRLEFSSLLREDTHLTVVVTFLAVLELIRMREIRATQSHPFGEITLQLITGGEEVG